MKKWGIWVLFYNVWLMVKPDESDPHEKFARYWKSMKFDKDRAELVDALMKADWQLRVE